MITHPSAEACKEIVGVLKDEGGRGFLGKCGLQHDKKPNWSGEGDKEGWKGDAAMTEAVSLEDEEGTDEKHCHVGNSDKQAPPAEVSHSQTHTRTRYLHQSQFKSSIPMLSSSQFLISTHGNTKQFLPQFHYFKSTTTSLFN